jgi:uncharacterized protein with HEPN domain
MPSLSEKDREGLERLWEAIEKIENFAGGFADAEALQADEAYLDAILMNFIVIGACVSRLSADFKQANANVPWQQITGLRNLVAHDYWGIDVEMVWQVIHENLVALRSNIELYLRT